eukprot:jgi/Tetstr1/439054/TSEL_027545.t1
MEINRPEEQHKAAVGAALDAPRGGKTQLPQIRSAITAEQIAGTRLPPAARPRLTDGQRPPRRKEHAPQETTTTANMNINRPEEHQAAEVGATIDAPRNGRAVPIKNPSTIAAKNFTYTRLPPVVRSPLHVSSRQSRQPPIDLPHDTDCATQVALLFGNPATHNRATQPPKIRSAIQQAPQETTTTTNKNINIPEEHHAAEVGATIDAPRSGRAKPPKTPKIATAHHPAPHTADQSAMHHGQLPKSSNHHQLPSYKWIVCGGSAGKAPNPKMDARLRLSAPPPKNFGRF